MTKFKHLFDTGKEHYESLQPQQRYAVLKCQNCGDTVYFLGCEEAVLSADNCRETRRRILNPYQIS